MSPLPLLIVTWHAAMAKPRLLLGGLARASLKLARRVSMDPAVYYCAIPSQPWGFAHSYHVGPNAPDCPPTRHDGRAAPAPLGGATGRRFPISGTHDGDFQRPITSECLDKASILRHGSGTEMCRLAAQKRPPIRHGIVHTQREATGYSRSVSVFERALRMSSAQVGDGFRSPY